MTATFVVARNPEPVSTLPYLIRLPLSDGLLLLKAREPWPRTAKVYCHRADPADWPEHAEVLEEIPVRSCVRRGVAIDLVLDRPRENRSQLVFTRLPGQGGREAIFWQTARTTAKARPGVRVPRRRAAGNAELEILVDTRERYPWRFTHQQAHTRRQALPAGDYGVELDEELVATVERKTLADLAGSLVDGSMAYVLAELASLPRAAVVVEDRYSGLFKLEHVNGGGSRSCWPPCRSATRPCRSCSPRPAHLPRSGPSGSSVPPSPTGKQPVRPGRTREPDGYPDRVGSGLQRD